MEELKSCPFCGIIPEFCEIRGLTDQPMKLWHTHNICPLSETIVCQKPTKEKCIEYWNLRIPPATAGKSVDVEKLADFMCNEHQKAMMAGCEVMDMKFLATAIKEAIERNDVC